MRKFYRNINSKYDPDCRRLKNKEKMKRNTLKEEKISMDPRSLDFLNLRVILI